MSCHDQRVTAPSELTGPRVRLVPCAPEHHARLREIHLEPEVRRWWQDPANDFPANMNRSINYTVMRDERVIGFAQWYSEDETIIRFAGFHLFLDPAVHGRGLGLETVRVLCAHLIDDHGFHRIVADPEVETRSQSRASARLAFGPSVSCGNTCATASASGRTAFCLTCSPRSSSAASWRVGLPLPCMGAPGLELRSARDARVEWPPNICCLTHTLVNASCSSSLAGACNVAVAMQPVRDPELIGVRFDGMGRAVGQAAAAPVLREQGFARVFGAAEAGEDVVAPPPVARRRDGVGYLNEDALLAMLTELHERTGAALAAGRFPVVYGADCSVLLATVPALKGAGGHAGLLHLDAHEDATPMASTDSGEAANMEIRLLTGLDGERPAADMPVSLPALGPDVVAILGVRDAAFREELDVPSIAGQLFMRTAEEVGAAPRDCAREAVARLQAVTPAWWLHVDLDVLSWQAFRACGAPGEAQLPGGLSWEALTLAAGEALRSPGCRGWSVAIYNPDLDPDRSDAVRIVAFARDASAGVLTPA